MLSVELDCSQGETAITDHNLLEIKRAGPRDLRVYKAKGRDEEEKGFDWEWWIGGRRRGWWRYSVQAKKLNLKSDRYDHIRHRVGTRFQIDILADFARSNNSIPLYCFYNYITDSALAQRSWNCNLGFDAPQLGCTVAPLHDVQPQHRSGARKTFRALHDGKSTLPWRCLVCCPNIVDPRMPHPLAPTDHDPTPFDGLPPHLGPDNVHDVIIDLPEEFYGSELGGYPKRIMVIDTDELE